jgi:hypothetical protein
LYKDKDSKNTHLFAGPVWDFNIALGNADYCNAATYFDWAMDFNQHCPQDGWIIPFWWRKLWDDPAFQQRLKNRWAELRANQFADDKIDAVLDSLIGVVNQAQVRNWQRWPVLNQYVWPNAYCCGSYSQHVVYLENWLHNRLQWMDKELDTTSVAEYDPAKAFKTQVYPNPSDDFLTFKYYVHYYDQVSIRIYDAAGRSLAYFHTPTPVGDGENYYILQHSLMQGFYFYTILVNGVVESNGKFVVK